MDERNGMGKEVNSPESFDALRYHEHGKPIEVLRLEKLSIPPCASGEVTIQMEAAALHPSDIGLIVGSYGTLRSLPTVAGREGVGTICAVGRGVDEKLLGRPVALPFNAGAWQEYMNEKADHLILLPSLVPLDQLALALLNPMTAWRLLNDFEYLKPGDFIIQNAGNSAVGLSIIQFAGKLGVRCISMVRSEEARDKLLSFSKADVFLDNDDSVGKVAQLTEGKKCALALNSVGGKSALRLAKCLRNGAVHVTFGAMSGQSVRFPTRHLIFDDIRFVGFWLDRWKQGKDLNDIRKSIEDVLQPLALTEIRHPVDSVFSLSEFSEAFSRNNETRLGKVLFARDKEAIHSLRDSAGE
jgi:NADPH:quinone reductase-like Zn-dependent oxidoreductase